MISPGDLSVNQLVTVHSYKDDDSPPASSWSDDPFTSMFSAMRGATKNTALLGEVLRIKAVQLPYIVVIAGRDFNMTLDTRTVNLMGISRQYAKARLADSPSSAPKPAVHLMLRRQ